MHYLPPSGCAMEEGILQGFGILTHYPMHPSQPVGSGDVIGHQPRDFSACRHSIPALPDSDLDDRGFPLGGSRKRWLAL